jgi:Fe-S cluster assembly iron-binding protein IscA
MLVVTDRARHLISRALENNEPGNLHGLRITITDFGEFDVHVDDPRNGDTVIESNGRPIVIIPPETAPELDSAVLDAQETADGMDLTLQVPAIDEEGFAFLSHPPSLN